MGRKLFTQELKELAKASEGIDAGGCWREARYPPGTGARNVADTARRQFERDEVPESELLACEPEGPEGSRLADCRSSTCRSVRATRESARSESCSSMWEERNRRWWYWRLAFATHRRSPGSRAFTSWPTAGCTHLAKAPDPGSRTAASGRSAGRVEGA
jgi:hypothetical protein